MKNSLLITIAVATCHGIPVCAQRIVPVGSGIPGANVNAMVEYNGQLIVGGFYPDFNGFTDRNLQGWDGLNHYLIGDAFDQPSERVEALTTLNTDLIAAGREITHGHIARWDGVLWNTMDGGMNDRVYCMTLHNGELYAGGLFTIAGGIAAPHIAKWTGSDWESIGGGLNGEVRALASYGGELFAGGDFTADSNGNPLFRIARWAGNSWLPVGSGVNEMVKALLPNNGDLLIGGQFSFDMGSTVNSPNLMIYSGGALQPSPLIVDGNVQGLSSHTSVGLCIGTSSEAIFYNGSSAHRTAFGRAKAIIGYNGERFICGAGGNRSYADVVGIGKLLDGNDFEHLDVSNIDAGKTPWGYSFFEDGIHGAQFEAPKGDSANTIFAFTPWIVGYLNGDLLDLSPFYASGMECDAGPHGTQQDSAFYNSYFQVWKLTQDEINHHVVHWSDSGYIVPHTIASWPGNGDLNNSEAQMLAPFSDVDGDALYEPQTGDAPLIRGDMALYSISHFEPDTNTAGPANMALDIHSMHYAFGNSWDAYLHNSTFLNIKFINRGASTVDDARIGAWSDFNIGGADDDYIGCDTSLHMFFGYNGDSQDLDGPGGSTGYHDRPPAQAIAFLSHELRAHNNTDFLNGLPLSSLNVLAGLQGNGDPITRPGGDTTTFLYSGDPNDPLQWHEASLGNGPGDRRAIGSIGPFTFAPGDTICVDLAFVFAQDTLGDNLTSVTLLKQRVAQVRDWYAQQDINCTGSYGVVTGLSNPQTSVDGFEVFPNPTTGVLSLSRTGGKSASVQVFSTTGSLLSLAGWTAGSNSLILDVSALPAGVYVIVVQDKWNRTIKRFVKSDG